VIVLEDNDVLHIVGGGYGIYNTAQADVETAVPRRLQLLEMEVDSIMKVRHVDLSSLCMTHCRRCVVSQRQRSRNAGTTDQRPLSQQGDRGTKVQPAATLQCQKARVCENCTRVANAPDSHAACMVCSSTPVLVSAAVACVVQGGYDHYMQKEIHEQPESILQTMRGRVRFEKAVVSAHAHEPCTACQKGLSRLFLVRNQTVKTFRSSGIPERKDPKQQDGMQASAGCLLQVLAAIFV
jgi:hypothetical protein